MLLASLHGQVLTPPVLLLAFLGMARLFGGGRGAWLSPLLLGRVGRHTILRLLRASHKTQQWGGE